jgi:hypothetical protein
MRYLLIVAGLFAVLWGSSVAASDSASRAGPLLVQAGAIFLAAGLATVDVVLALRDRRP